MFNNFQVVAYALKNTLDFQYGISAWICSFIKGMNRQGISSTKIVPLRGTDPMKCDLAVLWGVRDIPIINFCRDNNIPFICIERGFIPNRSKWSMAGYNGLNGLANFCNENSPSDRWEKYFTGMMQHWNLKGQYVLLLGQVQGDSALYGLDVENWVNTCKKFFVDNKIPFMYRPHPGEVLVKMDIPPGLYEAIDNAFCVVTYNSSAGVQSILRGKPTISMHPGSMVWNITEHTLNDCLNQHMPDRTQWRYSLAYSQWTVEEFLHGDAWEHLKQFFK